MTEDISATLSVTTPGRKGFKMTRSRGDETKAIEEWITKNDADLYVVGTAYWLAACRASADLGFKVTKDRMSRRALWVHTTNPEALWRGHHAFMGDQDILSAKEWSRLQTAIYHNRELCEKWADRPAVIARSLFNKGYRCANVVTVTEALKLWRNAMAKAEGQSDGKEKNTDE